MTRFMFQWALIGSTIIEAENLDAAQIAFDEITTTDMVKNDPPDYEQTGIFTESFPGCFDTDVG